MRNATADWWCPPDGRNIHRLERASLHLGPVHRPFGHPQVLRHRRQDGRRHLPRRRRAGLRDALAHPRILHLRPRAGLHLLHGEPRPHRAAPGDREHVCARVRPALCTGYRHPRDRRRQRGHGPRDARPAGAGRRGAHPRALLRLLRGLHDARGRRARGRACEARERIPHHGRRAGAIRHAEDESPAHRLPEQPDGRHHDAPGFRANRRLCRAA